MDETTKTAQDSPPRGKAPDGTEGTTPTTPEVYTKAQVEEAVQKARVQAGRDAKALDNKARELEAREKDLADWQKKRDEAEFDGIKDDPEKVSLYQRRKALREAQAAHQKAVEQFETEKQTHAEELKLAKESERDVTIWEIAAKRGADPVKLKEKVIKYNLSESEAIDDLAQILEKPKDIKSLLPDSSGTTGGAEDLSNLSPREKIDRGIEIAKQKKK